MGGQRILVTGAAGTVGGLLVRLLAAAGVPLRAAVHRAAAARRLPAEVEAVVADFAAPATLLAACRDVHTLYLLTPQVPAATDYVRAAVAAAHAAGVTRIVRQSMHDAPHGRDRLSVWHREAEAIVAASGIAWTILRPNAFMQNFATIYAPTIRDQGFFRLPIGAAPLSLVDARDIAAAAAVVLLADGHEGAAYTLTGPEALTGAAMAAALTEVLGRPVRHVDEAEDAGQPPRDPGAIAMSEALVELSAEMRLGQLASVSPDVERLTGHPATSFRRFAEDYRAAWL